MSTIDRITFLPSNTIELITEAVATLVTDLLEFGWQSDGNYKEHIKVPNLQKEIPPCSEGITRLLCGKGRFKCISLYKICCFH